MKTLLLSFVTISIFFSCNNPAKEVEQTNLPTTEEIVTANKIADTTKNMGQTPATSTDSVIEVENDINTETASQENDNARRLAASSNNNFLTFYNKFIDAITSNNKQAFNSCIDANFGVYIVESSGAMPKITKYYNISNYKSLTKTSFFKLKFNEIKQNAKRAELPRVICDKNPYDKQGCFYQEINPLLESQLWNYAGLNEKEIQAITAFANTVKITVINTSNYTYYFSFSENQWHIAFIDLRTPCSA